MQEIMNVFSFHSERTLFDANLKYVKGAFSDYSLCKSVCIIIALMYINNGCVSFYYRWDKKKNEGFSEA